MVLILLGMDLLDLMLKAYFMAFIAFFTQTQLFFILAIFQRRFFLLLQPWHLLLLEQQNRRRQIMALLVLHQYLFESKGQELMLNQLMVSIKVSLIKL